MAQTMTTGGLAKYLKLHEMTIRKYAGKGIIPGKWNGQCWHFKKEEIDSWLAGENPRRKKGKDS